MFHMFHILILFNMFHILNKMDYRLTVPLVDIVAITLSKCFYPDEEVHHNRRWFLIHTYVNGLVTWYNYTDLKECLLQPMSHPQLPMSVGAYYATDMMIVAHFYHMIVFREKLRQDEWFHHLIMMTFNGISVYYFHNKAQAASAFFLSGLPGLIDYALLWCVKMKFILPETEKRIYLYLTSYIRSPGAIIVSYISLPYISKLESWPIFIYSGFLVGLTFWNGQYYMKKSCVDYGKYISK